MSGPAEHGRDGEGLPLCVDLDGTLVATDLLYESFASFLHNAAGAAWRVPLWLAQGRPVLKRELAARATVDAATLPYREPVVAYLEAEREAGRPVVLATASQRLLAEAVAAHVGVFSQVIATDRGPNLKGARKKAVLDEQFGPGAYEYVGDSSADLAVWDGAAAASCVGLTPARLEAVSRTTTVVRHFDKPRAGARDWLRVLRARPLLENGLVFLPLLLGRAEPVLLVLGFVALALLTIALGVLDDLVDLAEDRARVPARRPPFADGTLSILSGLAAGSGLAGAAFALAALALPWPFVALLIAVALAGLCALLFGHRVRGLAPAGRIALLALRAASGFVLASA